MPLQPRLARERQIKAQYQERVVVIDALPEYLAYFRNRMTCAHEPDRAEAAYASAERLYRVVYLLIVLIVVKLVGDEINGHRYPPPEI